LVGSVEDGNPYAEPKCNEEVSNPDPS